MPYEYDIFLSYKRHAESRRWLVEHFQPLLEHYVGLELGREARVFRDDQDIEAGATWPVDLGRALGNSRVLVALWTRTYFHSDWCTRELSTMLARERDEQLRTPARPGGLIIPVVAHDCTDLPSELHPLQTCDVRRYYNTRMRRDSELAEQLCAQIMTIAPGVASAVEAAPAWRPAWPLTTAADFLAAVRRAEPPRQTAVPRFGS